MHVWFHHREGGSGEWTKKFTDLTTVASNEIDQVLIDRNTVKWGIVNVGEIKTKN